MVLLKNDPVGGRTVLPLDPTTVRSIALIGRLAAKPNMGDHGSSDVRPPTCVTPFDGLRAAFPDAEVGLVEDDDVEAAREAAAAADVALVVVGYDARDEGEYIGPDAVSTQEMRPLFPPIPDEKRDMLAAAFGAGEQDSFGGDRTSLTLRPVDEDIIRGVVAANQSTVVVIVASGAVLTESWRSQVPVVLMMWYPGMEGGHA
jgi:beta-glucosidase